MIGFLRGRLARKQPPALLIDVGGVGYELEAPMSTFYRLPQVGDTVELQGYFRVADGYFAADHTSFWGCKVG